jgi:hypothetical protein
MPFRSLVPWLAGAFLLLLGFHLWLALGLPGPILYEDTMGYLAIARSIGEWAGWGAGWRPEPALNAPHGVYHFGYPLLLAPLYLVLDSSWRVFQAARVLDSLLASLQIVLLYLLGRGVFGLGRGFALGAALAAALYPAWMLQSSFVWTESLFAFLFSLWVLLAWESLRRRHGGWPVAFGLSGACLYMVHPRGLGLVVVTLAALLLWAVRGIVDRRQAVAGIMATAALFAGTRLLNARFLEKLWVTPPRPDEGFVLGHLLDPAVWLGALPARVAGQIWYLQAATLGVFGIGVVGLALLAWRGLPRNSKDGRDLTGAHVAVLVLVGASSVLFASATVMLPAFRSDHLVYGRYNESLIGIFLLAGLAGLRGTRRERLARLAESAAVLALLGLMLPRVLPANLLAEQPMPLNVLGVLPWNPWATLDLGATTVRALGALGLFSLAALASRRAAVAGLALFFALSTIATERLLAPWCHAVRAVVTLQDVIRPLAPESVSYDQAGLSTFGFNGYGFWLDRVTFRLFDAAAGERPADDLVIASSSWSAPGSRLIAAEAGMDQALWVLPGPLQADLERRGWLIPTDPTAPLPDAASRSRIERLDGDEPITMAGAETVSLRFRVEHAGQGAPWMPSGAMTSPWGSVRLGGQWSLEAGEGAAPVASFPLRGELPRVVRPGEAVEIGMDVSARNPGGAPLKPGSYVLEISLVQEGVRWFSQTLRIPVEVRP